MKCHFTSLGCCLRSVFRHGVIANAVVAGLKMQMWSGRVSGRADMPDELSGGDRVAYADCDITEMSVNGYLAVAVVYHYILSVTAAAAAA